MLSVLALIESAHSLRFSQLPDTTRDGVNGYFSSVDEQTIEGCRLRMICFGRDCTTHMLAHPFSRLKPSSIVEINYLVIISVLLNSTVGFMVFDRFRTASSAS